MIIQNYILTWGTLCLPDPSLHEYLSAALFISAIKCSLMSSHTLAVSISWAAPGGPITQTGY